MEILSRLEQSTVLDRLVQPGQKLARLIPPGKVRDALNGVWLGHPAHPALVQVPTGAWLSASVVGLRADQEPVARALTAIGLAGAIPAALTGLVDWSEQHEQQMRVGVVHALANATAITCYATSLATATRRPRCRHLIEPGWHALMPESDLREAPWCARCWARFRSRRSAAAGWCGCLPIVAVICPVRSLTGNYRGTR